MFIIFQEQISAPVSYPTPFPEAECKDFVTLSTHLKTCLRSITSSSCYKIPLSTQSPVTYSIYHPFVETIALAAPCVETCWFYFIALDCCFQIAPKMNLFNNAQFVMFPLSQVTILKSPPASKKTLCLLCRVLAFYFVPANHFIVVVCAGLC